MEQAQIASSVQLVGRIENRLSFKFHEQLGNYFKQQGTKQVNFLVIIWMQPNA